MDSFQIEHNSNLKEEETEEKKPTEIEFLSI